MEWVETTGRSVEDALDAALDELGVDESDVEYEVLDQGKAGLFGRIGSSPARLRARVRPVSREKPGERQRRNRRQGSRGSKDPSSGQDRTPQAPRASAGDTAVATTSAAEAGGRPDAAERPGGGGNRRRRRGGRGRGGGGASRATAGATNGAAGAPGDGHRDQRPRTAGGRDQGSRPERSRPERTESMETDLSVEEQAAIAESFTTGLVDAFDLGADVEVIVDDEAILVSIDGSSVGLLVGPKGATLTAIEELVRTVVQRQTDGHGARINVDVGGYRAKRREALEAFTRELAGEVIESQRAKALEPMSALDRKVVHDAAAEIDGVVTESDGEDPRRRVVIRPA